MVPLTVRSYYSMMWGTASVRAICRQARLLGYRRLALTDTDNLCGLWPFLAACRDEGIIPAVGAEVTALNMQQRAVCLVKNDQGYRSLCQLLTQRHLKKDFDLKTGVTEHAKGLIVLTRDAGLLKYWYKCGVHVAAAMPRLPLSESHILCKTAKQFGISIVATPGSFFLKPEDHIIHRYLRAIDSNTGISKLSVKDMAPENAWLAGLDEYRRRFNNCPETLDATEKIADQLEFKGPNFGLVMPPWKDKKGKNAAHVLREAAYAGAAGRYGNDLPEPVVDRLEKELQIIENMEFSAYFLVVQNIVKHSPRTCGRGSGAASLVAYSLGITNVCPVRHNLYFERFLNPGRKDPPDIDVDFAWDERDRVLETVLDQYRGHVAMVSNHVFFKPRMAIREVAKVYGLSGGEITRITKRLPWHFRETPDGELMEEIKRRPETRALDFPQPWPEILALSQKMIGIPRYLSVHPGGVVITPEPIDHYVPIQRAPKGVSILQWEKEATEDAGLVKIDLLGNRSLGVVRDAIKNVRDNNIVFHESGWDPESDLSTQQAVACGKTMGCFYIESPAMRLLQKKSRVGDFEHLVIHSSIIRPAANDYIREYIRRLHGGAWDPIHPLVSDVLDETFGIMVYQEDVSKVAVSMAGFSHCEADGLRKIMSKKDRARRLQDYYQRFVDGAKARNVSQKQIESVWAMMMSFSGYSFCKPHSASYARVSFQAAYLKVHYPAEFMAAVISNQGGFYSTFAYVSESMRMELTIAAPDVNQSDIRWRGKGRKLRVGLLSVKGLSAETQRRIVSERQVEPYLNMNDFLHRVQPDEPEVRALIHCGALDQFHPNGSRPALMWEFYRRRHQKAHREKNLSLFETEFNGLEFPQLPPEKQRDRLRREFAVLGFLCDRHPISLYENSLKNSGVIKAIDLPKHVGKNIRLAAWLITGKQVRTKHGEPMEFLTFEDETDSVETTFFPKTYHRFCHMLDWNRPYILSGKVEQDWGAITLTVRRVELCRP